MNKQIEIYQTTDLKLAALLLAEIPCSCFEMRDTEKLNIKKFAIHFEIKLKEVAEDLVDQFINRCARVDLYRYNKNLNLLRDKIRLTN